jgi:cytochrome P450
MAASTMTIDLSSPRLLLNEAVLDDPREFYDTLRREAPVWQVPGQDTFVVSDPSLIREAVGRTSEFSSNLVNVLYDDGTGRLVPFPIAPFGSSIHVFSTADPPLHDRHRKLVQPHLSPAAVERFAPAITAIVEEQLALLLDAGRIDAVAAFSDLVPARAICEVLGLPDADVPSVLAFANGTGALLDGVTDRAGMDRAATSGFELTIFVHEHLSAALAKDPAERRGLLAIFAEAIEADTVTLREVCDMVVVFVTAGSETTASLLATAIATLAADHDRQQALRDDPSAIPQAIEELLRDDGPFQFHYRFTPTDTSLGGVQIPANSQVLLMWAAANRPSEGAPASAQPEGRAKPPHFAFGRGLHHCIGAPLARLEARISLERLLAATTLFTLDPAAPPTRRPSIFIRRHGTLPIIVERS